MSWAGADYSSAITAVSTVVYTGGTFLLWKTTRDAVQLTREQLRTTERRTRDETWAGLVRSHRDLFQFALADPKFAAILEHELGRGKDDVYRDFLGTWLINHLSQVFVHYHSGDISEETWLGVGLDMQDVFRWPFVRDRWRKVQYFYDPEFRDYVNTRMLHTAETAGAPLKPSAFQDHRQTGRTR